MMIKRVFFLFFLGEISFSILYAADKDPIKETSPKSSLLTSRSSPALVRTVSFSKEIVYIFSKAKTSSQPVCPKSKGEERRKAFAAKKSVANLSSLIAASSSVESEEGQQTRPATPRKVSSPQIAKHSNGDIIDHNKKTVVKSCSAESVLHLNEVSK